jgi:transcriptional regulator GlxA family with amidase domain
MSSARLPTRQVLTQGIAPRDRRITHALELLTTRRSQVDLNMAEIAGAVNLSTSRLRHLFSQELGISPRHYLKQLRLCEAQRLLKHTFLEVKEVMAAAGFKDPSHFARDYKLLFHQSPSETRSSGGRKHQHSLSRKLQKQYVFHDHESGHLLKEQTDKTLTKHSKSLRLQRARELILESFLDVKEVAALVGFTDFSRFVRDYKAAYGETPSQSGLASKEERSQTR